MTKLKRLWIFLTIKPPLSSPKTRMRCLNSLCLLFLKTQTGALLHNQLLMFTVSLHIRKSIPHFLPLLRFHSYLAWCLVTFYQVLYSWVSVFGHIPAVADKWYQLFTKQDTFTCSWAFSPVTVVSYTTTFLQCQYICLILAMSILLMLIKVKLRSWRPVFHQRITVFTRLELTLHGSCHLMNWPLQTHWRWRSLSFWVFFKWLLES